MKLRKLIFISGLLLGFVQTIDAQNLLITYPAPLGTELKNDFTVKVRQPGGKAVAASNSHLSRQSGRSKRGPAPCRAGLHELFRLQR